MIAVLVANLMTCGSQRKRCFNAGVAGYVQILDVFAAVERLHDVSADSLRKSAGKAKGSGAPLVFSLSRGPNKPPIKVRSFNL